MPEYRVLLAHADEIGWTDVRHVLQAMSDVNIIGDAESRSQATQLAMTHHPDILLLGASLDEKSTAPLLTMLRQSSCPHSIVAIFAFTSELDVMDLMTFARLGVVGYFVWDDVIPAVLRLCLEALFSGEILIGSRTPAMAFLAQARPQHFVEASSITCSSREQAVLEGLSEGLSRKEIAAQMHLSQRTIGRTIEQLEKSLHARDAFTLGMRAAIFGLIT